MFFNRRNRYRDERQGSVTKTIVNIATIVSTTVTCIRLAYYGILSVQTSALIMLGVVIFVALGNNVAKVVLAAAALFLFVLLYSYGNKQQFSALMTSMIALILALVGLYVIIRGIIGK